MGFTIRHFLPIKTHPDRRPLELAADVRLSLKESTKEVCASCNRRGAGTPQVHLECLETENGVAVAEGTPIFNAALKVLREEYRDFICNDCFWDDDLPDD